MTPALRRPKLIISSFMSVAYLMFEIPWSVNLAAV